jgi:hypothetical protein
MFRQATERDLPPERIATITEMVLGYNGQDAELRRLQAIAWTKRPLKAEEMLTILNTEREPKPSIEKPRCVLCGGNKGRLNDENQHGLCRALNERGLETPSLGDDCPVCRGEGRLCVMTAGYALYNPNQRAIDAAFPKCPACNATGKEAK